MSMLDLHLVARIGAERVLNSIPQGLLIAAFAWLLLRVFATRNSATRFIVWFSALLAIAAAPFLPDVTGAPLSHALGHQVALPDSWAVAVFAVWIAIAAVVMFRFAVGIWKLRRLRRNCLPIAASDRYRALHDVVAGFAGTRSVSLCTSKHVRVPTAIGFFKPLIVFPEWSLQELTTEELKVILLHEFAHLRRMDDWTNLAQQLVRTVFFFHPAVIWIEKRLSLEREMACDDVVLAETGNPGAYAECLVKLAERTLAGRALTMAQAVISHARQTCLRLARILDVDRTTSASAFKPALGISTILAALCLVVVPHVPRLVVVENSVPSPVFSSSAESSLHAVAIPAVARLNNDSASLAVPASIRAATTNRPHTRVLTVSKHKHIDRRQPLLARATARPSTRPPEFLVMARTVEFERNGLAMVRIYVWQVVRL